MKRSISILIMTGSLLFLGSCKDDDSVITNVPNAAPVVSSISPDRGKSGTEVTILGVNFGITAEANTVTFNGTKATVIAANETALKAEVPPDAGSGPVAVTVAGQTGSGPQFSWFPDNARFVNGIFGSDPANDCSDIGKPCSTIAHAIDQADEGDQIDIAAGTYTEMLTIDKSLTLRGAGKDPLSGTIIQAHPDPGMATGRVIYIPEENVVSIQGVIIRHGNASGGGESGRGGGIRVENSTLNLTDVMFEKNSATYGGAIHNAFSAGTYVDVTFSFNKAVRGSADNQGTGGGVYNFASSPVIEGAQFFGNKADTHGGGIRNVSNSAPALTDVSFNGNTAKFGGGIANTNQSAPLLTRVTFNKNSAEDSGGGMYNYDSSPILLQVTFSENHTPEFKAKGGGGMYNGNGSNPTLTDVLFEKNLTENGGGGMKNDDSSPLLTHVVFSENTAYYAGGGMFNNAGSSPTLRNVSFIGNRSGFRGGGIANFEGSNATLTGVLLFDNEADSGGGGMCNIKSSPKLLNVALSRNSTGTNAGGIYNIDHSHPTLTNTIVWGNIANLGHELMNITNSTAELTYSIYSDDDKDIVSTMGSSFSATSSLTEDPLFVDPANGDLRVQAGSRAINAGDPATDLSIFATGGEGYIDLDGYDRVVGGRIDIGAYENQ